MKVLNVIKNVFDEDDRYLYYYLQYIFKVVKYSCTEIVPQI